MLPPPAGVAAAVCGWTRSLAARQPCTTTAAAAAAASAHALRPGLDRRHATTASSAGPPQQQAPRGGGSSKDRSQQLSALQRFGRDLTAEARRGLLDPVIGRADVMQRVLQVLLRRMKHNPLLIGEAGVGKTAIVEGLAQLIAAPSPPPG